VTTARAIAYGTLTVGVLDALDAIVFFGLRNSVPAYRIFQAIASGLLGPASFQGGAATVALGVVCHFTVACGIVTVFVLVSTRWPALARRPFLWGPLYGIAAYLVMNLVVVPLSAAGPSRHPIAVVVNGLLIHMIGVGTPAALAARAAQGPEGTRSGGRPNVPVG